VEAGGTTMWYVYVKLDKQWDSIYIYIYIYINRVCKYYGVSPMAGKNGTPEMEG